MKQPLSRQLPRARTGHRRRPAPPKPAVAARRIPELDLAVQKVRKAGGPVDYAAYGCPCGYGFSAAVSTTVSCPHCGATQAW